MDLNYSPEDIAFREKTRRWLEANVPTQELATLEERKAWHRKLYEAGYVGMLWPKEYGGWGASPMHQAIVQDEMARVGAPPRCRTVLPAWIHGPIRTFCESARLAWWRKNAGCARARAPR